MQSFYISCVIPVFNEEKNLWELYTRLSKTLEPFGKAYEIIFINDGSYDKSSEILKELHDLNPRAVRVIEFNNNFGQHMAIMAGFERVRGEIIITLDADLQNPPEEIPKLVTAIEAGHDVVNTHRLGRKDHWLRCIISNSHNKIRSWMMPKLKMKDEGCMLRAYRRQIVDLMAKTQESTTFIPALALSYALNPVEIGVAHSPRFAGKSNYNFYKLIRYNFDLITGFSLVPLQFFTLVGMLISALSFACVVLLVIRRFIIGPEVEGVFTLFAILFFLVGMVLLGLGVVGEYVGRIYHEVRKRPRFVIHKILDKHIEFNQDPNSIHLEKVES